MSGLLVLVAVLAGIYGVARHIHTSSPWGLLAKTYRTQRKMSLQDIGSFSSSPVIVREYPSSNAEFKSSRSGVYFQALPEGMLFCSHPMGNLLGLSANFLIPWLHADLT